MNISILDQKIQALSNFRHLSRSVISQFARNISDWNVWDGFRINPYTWAQKNQFSFTEVLDVMIHGVKVGLFDFHYSQICPGCGGIEHAHSSLDSLESDRVWCTVCSREVESSMDDFVEVSFMIGESLGLGLPDPYQDAETYMRYYHSQNMEPPPEKLKAIQESLRAFGFSDPDEKIKIEMELEPGADYRIMNLESHNQVIIHVSQLVQTVEQVADLDLHAGGFAPKEVHLDSGPVSIRIHNLFKSTVGCVVQKMSELYTYKPGIVQKTPTWHKFLTGKDLLNNQSFRDLFRIQHLAPDMKLKIKSLTILFTDLKGSTDMYSRVGDLSAYSVVQKHFQLLTDCVRRHNGAIVKTMGDAVMASFSNSSHGLAAAFEMIREMKAFNETLKDQDLGLKIGLHEGPALAVNADERLDYFGQSINLAARVQGLAEAGEIWITDTVHQDPEIQDMLNQSKIVKETKLATLKGINGKTMVYRLGVVS